MDWNLLTSLSFMDPLPQLTGTGYRGGGTGHGKGHGQGSGREGAHGSKGPGAMRGPEGKEGGGDAGHRGQGGRGPGAGEDGKGKGHHPQGSSSEYGLLLRGPRGEQRYRNYRSREIAL